MRLPRATQQAISITQQAYPTATLLLSQPQRHAAALLNAQRTRLAATQQLRWAVRRTPRATGIVTRSLQQHQVAAAITTDAQRAPHALTPRRQPFHIVLGSLRRHSHATTMDARPLDPRVLRPSRCLSLAEAAQMGTPRLFQRLKCLPRPRKIRLPCRPLLRSHIA